MLLTLVNVFIEPVLLIFKTNKMMNDFFSNKLRLLKFILLSIALGNFFISEGYATTKSVVITQQEKTVKGKVTDDNDEPLIGVSVRVAGTSAGTVTDSDGMFQLNVAGTDVLEFSYVGYKTVKVIAGNKPFLSVIVHCLSSLIQNIPVHIHHPANGSE